MKKLLIFFGILFLVDAVYGQSALKPVKLDNLVTVSLPVNNSKKDTLGQQIYSANTDFGYIMAIREPNAKGNQPLKKEKDLNSVLKTYIKGIESQAQGSAQFVNDTTVGTLKAKSFVLVTKDANGDNQFRKFVLLYTQDATYTFEYGYPEMRKDMIKDEAKAFFSSIKLSPELQRNDQYLDTASSASGVGTNVIIEIAGGIIIISLVLWLILRKKNTNEFA